MVKDTSSFSPLDFALLQASKSFLVLREMAPPNGCKLLSTLKSYAINDNIGNVDLEFDYLFLKESNLEMCEGCFACIPRGEDKCPLKDSRVLC
jgi:hypothetical protein